ncbi:MAG: TIGR00730 family Rossman fold protein, partial [Patescibacteria group bacterium]
MHEDIQNKQTPFTIDDFDKAAKKRIAEIDDEFRRGFSFIKNYKKSVSFFGSARADESSDNYKFAYKLAKRISEELKYAVVTGGGPGIMEAGNRGAYDANGDSLGITIKLPNEQATNKYVQKSEDFYYFFVRKVLLSFSAEAYIFFPGGFGTLDEFFEILTLVQTHKIPSVPIILVGKEFWTPLEDYFKKYILE